SSKPPSRSSAAGPQRETDMPDWFAPKRHGFGSGRRMALQGWLALASFIGITVPSAQAFKDKPLIMGSIMVPVSALFILVAAKPTRGGWRWRQGGDQRIFS